MNNKCYNCKLTKASKHRLVCKNKKSAHRGMNVGDKDRALIVNKSSNWKCKWFEEKGE